jgi:hypothetical protein
MKKIFRPIDYDIIYLSYDEPNAEKNYADLLVKVPWAKRVHGIKGSDAAHKACAKLSETPRFTTVDGDNIIRSDFLNIEIDMEKYPTLEDSVISWSGYNVINGLMYGNGGLKCWTVDFVMNMRTHEACDPKDKVGQVDFCWDNKYIQMNDCYSDVHNNATPFQAWRAGFREGVKMSLDRGVKLTKVSVQEGLHWKNLHRLLIWCNVGADVVNGVYAMMGAREGCYLTNLTDWDYRNVRDFDYLTEYWNKEHKGKLADPTEYSNYLGTQLRKNLDLDVVTFNEDQSKFFKKVYRTHKRVDIIEND